MKTNISKKELKKKLADLLGNVQDVGFAIGNPELNYITDKQRDEYAVIESKLEEFITQL